MKRLLIVAATAAALLATGCQKTYVIDEVRTPIGFSTEVGKQTKAIVDNDGTYLNDQPFGVFAYGKQAETSTSIMTNIKIIKDSDLKWRADGSTKYYWPNDASTKLSFYAYSPYSTESDGMQKVPTYEGGIKIENYVHEDQTLDFMTASVINSTYEKPNGTEVSAEAKGTVNLQFQHQLTQLVFAVKKAADYTGIEMDLVSIKLNNIGNTATFENGAWADPTDTDEYTIDLSDLTTNLTTNAVSYNGMTVIPQSLTHGQTMTIEYKISGTGVATETVTRTVDLCIGTLTSWNANQKITYNISIGMKEILFNPSVENWAPETSSDIQINQ